MNDLMSGGLHRLWKDDSIAMLNPPRGDRPFRLLDLAGGTGDVAIRCARGGRAQHIGRACATSARRCSPSGAAACAAAGLEQAITFVEGNAEALPWPDRTFDACTIAFGIRNVTHIEKALTEAFRVVKPGGRFLCLEFSHVEVPILDKLYDFHSFQVIPRLGQLAAGDADSYRYLVESIRRFPPQKRFAKMIEAAGFERVTWRNLAGGIAAIHSGWRI